MSKALKDSPPFAETLVAWQKVHGRNHLPWQNTQDPYRVWLSEIMLQQTQVSTVLDYYDKFLQHFPTVADLAAATQDKVMGLWSGLGYYSRARNLHQCAKDVVARFGGKFPVTAADLITLPGIGRSTAAAVASFCFSERVAIMDGNVKRVLTRVWAYDADLSVSKNEKALWQLAENALPTRQIKTAMPRYSQALMDLGATLCLPRKPHCQACPVRQECKAFALGEPEKFPVKTRKIKRSSEVLWLLLAQNTKGEVWLEKRPPKGIWASLYSLPLFDSEASLRVVFEHNSKLQKSKKTAATTSSTALDLEVLPAFKHVLTHKDLHCHVVKVRLKITPHTPNAGAWFSEKDWMVLGLPTPVRHLLSNSL
jgi:A/G-specific adenine glycosylase